LCGCSWHTPVGCHSLKAAILDSTKKGSRELPRLPKPIEPISVLKV